MGSRNGVKSAKTKSKIQYTNSTHWFLVIRDIIKWKVTNSKWKWLKDTQRWNYETDININQLVKPTKSKKLYLMRRIEKKKLTFISVQCFCSNNVDWNSILMVADP